MDPYDQGATVASVLMDLGTQQMYLADGNPCTAPYRQLDYHEFLAKRSPVAEPAL
jgi:isopenicillin-N N-acyltransferase-like protein